MRRIVSVGIACTFLGLSSVSSVSAGGLNTAIADTQKHLQTASDQGLCVEWGLVALSAGWEPDQLPQLFRYMHRESRCLPDACSTPDRPELRQCRDWGLMQINDYSWKTTVRGLGLQMSDMHDPYWNLWFAKWLYDYTENRGGCGWQPWYGKCEPGSSLK
jgi:hypothetical protein